VPGLLIQLGLFGAAFVGFTIISDWRSGVIERLRVTPVSRLAILSDRVLRDVVTLLAQAVVLVLALGPGWLQGIGRATPFRYIINAMREAFAGQYLGTVMVEGVAVAIALAAACLWLAGRVFVRENA
jgi:ABC-type multidrug transport system permease subunit